MVELYNYKALVVKVYDGDTITVEVDLGFKTKSTITIRLLGINTPELRGEEKVQGKISRDRLRELILNKEIILKTAKDKKGKYGRYLGTVYTLEGINVNELLLTEGLAEKY